MQAILQLIKDTTFTVTGLSVLFYFWGYSIHSFIANTKGIPLEFMPDKSIQDYLLQGGYAGVFIIIPLCAIIYGIFQSIDKRFKGKLSMWAMAIWNKGPFVVVLLCILWVILTAKLVGEIANYTSKFFKTKDLTVKSLTLSDSLKVTNSYVGLQYVSKKGSSYVFVDNLSEKTRHIYLLHESQVKQIVLSLSE